MSRPIRIQYPGAAYHVMSRGNLGNKIYKDKKDYEIFLELLSKVLERHNVLCYAYCLMPNHYHLFLETLDPNLSIVMRDLNGKYTQKFNIKYKQYGHLFQGRYKAILIEKETYKYDLIRYIVINPVKAKLVKDPSDWAWSSHNEFLGKCKNPSFCLDLSKVLSFYDNDVKKARQNYLENINFKICEEVEEKMEKGVVLGEQEFINKIKKHFEKQFLNMEVKKAERYACRPKIEEIFLNKNLDKNQRNKLMKEAFLKYGYSLSEISKIVGLHYSTISRIVNGK